MTYREWTETSETHADYREATRNCDAAFHAPRPDANTWIHPGTKERRLYINNLVELVGLELSYYKSGNVSSAALSGKHISNTKATRLAGWLNSAKVWLDEDNTLNTRTYGGNEHFTSRDLMRIVRHACTVHGITNTK